MSEHDEQVEEEPADRGAEASEDTPCQGAPDESAAEPEPSQLVALSTKRTTRRSMLLKVGVAMNVVAAGMIGVPIVGYVASAARRRAYRKWIAIGKVDDYPERATRIAEYVNPFTVPWGGQTSTMPCWVRRIAGEDFQVFAINCTHLGCPVRWFQQSGLFLCPCHGGSFYEDGSHAAGPPPRGLYEYEHRIRNGNLEIRAGHVPTLERPV